MVIRDQIFSTIIGVFKRHGAITIDTPVFELKEILAGKYGEDSKLIYDLNPNGGEALALRYDLTVPFARWLAMNSVQSIKRYQIAKVYRRDQPAMRKGRMREFYQCDIDIAGQTDLMCDAEILRIVYEVFEDLNFHDYTVKINHRAILDGIFALCGVPADKVRTISSAVDKLDKSPWEEVRQEMIDKKLDPEVADQIWEFVQRKGAAKDILAALQGLKRLEANSSMVKGLEDMELLFTHLESFGVLDKVEFNLSLARGLDYYTGVIFEVVTEGSAPSSITTKKSAKPPKSDPALDEDEDRSDDPSVGVGSVAAGGRYDNLVGMFSGKKQIPCVGISFGVDRLFSLIKQRIEADESAAIIRNNEVEVYVMAFGGKGFTGMLKERMQVCTILWNAGIKTEFSYKQKPKLPAQFKAAEVSGIPFAIILGEDEQAQGKVRIKELGVPDDHPEKEGVLVLLTNLVEEVKLRLSRKSQAASVGEVTGKIDGLSVGINETKEPDKTGDDGV